MNISYFEYYCARMNGPKTNMNGILHGIYNFAQQHLSKINI